jgi:hypothetical protein
LTESELCSAIRAILTSLEVQGVAVFASDIDDLPETSVSVADQSDRSIGRGEAKNEISERLYAGPRTLSRTRQI